MITAADRNMFTFGACVCLCSLSANYSLKTPEKHPPYPPRYHGHRSGGPKIAIFGDVHTSHADGSGKGALSPAIRRCRRRRYIMPWLFVWEGKKQAMSHDTSDSWLRISHRDNSESRRGRSQPLTRENLNHYPTSGPTSTRWRHGGDTSTYFTSDLMTVR